MPKYKQAKGALIMTDLFTKMMNSMVGNNPQIMQIVKEIKESGMSAEELFYKKAQEKGIDPETILKQLR